MYIIRLAKIVMVACLAIFCGLVVFGNISDYETNFMFVKNVMSMDTTFPGNTLMYRAITDPALWQAAYVCIIAAEALAGVLLLIGAIRMWQVRRAPAAVFASAKGWVVAGVLIAFLVWFFGFIVIGGEWFLMWQSKTWNGQQAAFRFYITALAVLIFVNQTDGDLPDAVLSAKEAEPAKKDRAKGMPAKRGRRAGKS